MVFSVFAKKEMNTQAAKAFWAWFAEEEAWIIDCIEKRDSAFIWAIDQRLKPVFPYFKGELEFQLGYHDAVGEFFFFHFGKKPLIRDAMRLGQMMPASLTDTWKFICEK